VGYRQQPVHNHSKRLSPHPSACSLCRKCGGSHDKFGLLHRSLLASVDAAKWPRSRYVVTKSPKVLVLTALPRRPEAQCCSGWQVRRQIRSISSPIRLPTSHLGRKSALSTTSTQRFLATLVSFPGGQRGARYPRSSQVGEEGRPADQDHQGSPVGLTHPLPARLGGPS
jgi:hypothetical protein